MTIFSLKYLSFLAGKLIKICTAFPLATILTKNLTGTPTKFCFCKNVKPPKKKYSGVRLKKPQNSLRRFCSSWVKFSYKSLDKFQTNRWKILLCLPTNDKVMDTTAAKPFDLFCRFKRSCSTSKCYRGKVKACFLVKY